jgi:hypothetical protein
MYVSLNRTFVLCTVEVFEREKHFVVAQLIIAEILLKVALYTVTPVIK